MPTKKEAEQPAEQPAQQAQAQAQAEQAQQVPPLLMRLAQRIAKRRGITVEEALELIEKYFDVPEEGPLTSQARDITGALLEYVKAKTLLSDLASGDGRFDAIVADLKGSLATTVQQLQSQIDEIKKAVMDVVERQKQMTEEKVLNMVKEEVAKQLSPLADTLKRLEQYIAEDVQKKSQQQVQEILKPILEKLEELEARVATVEKSESKEVAGLKEQVNQLKGLLNEAKEALESLGFRVEGAKPITQEDVQKAIQQAIESMSPEQLKAIAEKKGLMVVDPKLPIDEVQKLIEEARQRGYQEAMQQNVMNSIKEFVDFAASIAERILPRLGPYMNNALASYAQRQMAAAPRKVVIEEVQPQGVTQASGTPQATSSAVQAASNAAAASQAKPGGG